MFIYVLKTSQATFLDNRKERKKRRERKKKKKLNHHQHSLLERERTALGCESDRQTQTSQGKGDSTAALTPLCKMVLILVSAGKACRPTKEISVRALGKTSPKYDHRTPNMTLQNRLHRHIFGLAILGNKSQGVDTKNSDSNIYIYK